MYCVIVRPKVYSPIAIRFVIAMIATTATVTAGSLAAKFVLPSYTRRPARHV